jgi:hypothetical protein
MQETVCCVRCYHTFVASDRIFQCALRPEPLAFELPPRTFQPLVAAEATRRDKRPLTSTVATATAAHRYLLNVVDSPYRRPVWVLPTPPKPAARKPGVAIAVPSWADRLSHPLPLRWPKRQRRTRYCGYEIPTEIVRPPPFAPPVTVSETLARRLYTGTPFNLTMLSPIRKAEIHANVPEPTDRLTGFCA